MATIFVKLLNLSISGGMLILLVFVFRFILMRTSRRATCLLWIVVGLRLVIPFSFESSLSIMPSGDFVVLDSASDTGKAETALTEQNYPNEPEIIGNDHATLIDGGSETEYYVGQKPMGSLPRVSEKYISSTDDHSDIEHFVNQDTSESLQSVSEENKSTTIDNSVIVQGNGSDETLYALPTRIPENAAAGTVNEHTDFLNSLPNRLGFQAKHFWDVLAYVWLLGFVVIAGYAVIGYTQMKRITAEAIPYRDGGAKNIFICDRIDTAFIFGIIKPKIYLPVNLQGKQLENVIAHENVHLIRHDHIRKIVGFMLLMVYWFNPLMWLAYAFFCKDIEFACDEQVISGMSRAEIKEYSDTLLFCSTNLHFMYGCPLAFGEVAVKDRVKAALNYKKPLFWVIILVFILLAGVGIFFFTKPTNQNDNLGEYRNGSDGKNITEPEIIERIDDGENTVHSEPTALSDELYEELASHNNIESTNELIRTMSMKYRYSIVHDFDFIYVMPDGTEFGTELGYSAGLKFMDYCKLWNDFEKIVYDEDLTKAWRESRESTNGYLVLATNNGYEDSLYGYKIFIKDGYIHLFAVDKSESEYDVDFMYVPYLARKSYNARTDKYMWSARLKDDYRINMYNIRRILLNKDMYDIYVKHCPYEEEINEPGIYPVNKGFLIDLDGDGTKEKVFIASCGWINYPEEENLEGWVRLSDHSDSGYEDYYGVHGTALVYINGRLMNDSVSVDGFEGSIPAFAFALTDVDVSDGRFEIVVMDNLGDRFFIYKNEKMHVSRTPGTSIVKISFYDGDDHLGEMEFTGTFFGNGTFSCPGNVSLSKYNLGLYSESVTYRLDSEDNIERIPGLFDVPFYYDEETIRHLENDGAREYWENLIKEHPEDVYLKLELTLKASKDYDDKSAITDNDRIELEPGFYYVDKTDGVSWIHIISPYSKVSGWFDMANLENYVKEYQNTGLEEAEDYGKIDMIFSNINHAG